MTPNKKKLIFWFEDQYEAFEAYFEELRESYEVEISANLARIEQRRERPVDLLIADLMIHPQGYDNDTREEVYNIYFEGTSWKHTGLEFLRRVRCGNYEQWGIARDIPVIVYTAVIDYEIEDQAWKHNISNYLEQPCPLNELETAIAKALASSSKTEKFNRRIR